MGYHDQPLQPFFEQTARLVHLADEMKDAAMNLRRTPAGALVQMPTDTQERRILRLKEIRNHRVARGQFFNPNLFGDPAWDILLYLMQMELEQRRVAVTTLAHASNVPQSTTLRWVNMLVEEGLLLRVDDHLDGRRVYVELSGEGRQRMDRYLDAVSSQPLVRDRIA